MQRDKDTQITDHTVYLTLKTIDVVYNQTHLHKAQVNIIKITGLMTIRRWYLCLFCTIQFDIKLQ